ncbi:MAG: sigma factor, partial [Rubrivivax sp.]
MQATRLCSGSKALRWPMMFFAPRRRGGPRSPSSALSSAHSSAHSSSIAAAQDGGGAAADDDLPAPSLLLRLAGGDLGALDTLYRRESGRVYRYALALSGNAAWAADATQEAFVALATRPEGFDATRGQLGAYLAGVARHALA